MNLFGAGGNPSWGLSPPGEIVSHNTTDARQPYLILRNAPVDSLDCLRKLLRNLPAYFSANFPAMFPAVFIERPKEFSNGTLKKNFSTELFRKLDYIKVSWRIHTKKLFKDSAVNCEEQKEHFLWNKRGIISVGFLCWWLGWMHVIQANDIKLVLLTGSLVELLYHSTILLHML